MKIEVETITPLFIGAGSDYPVLELSIENGVARRLSFPKIYEKDLEKLKEAIISGKTDEILTFIERNIRESDSALYEMTIPKEISHRLEPQRMVKEILKDISCCPYIPGSSLKGYIRTALIWKILTNDDNAYRGLLHMLYDMLKNGQDIRRAENRIQTYLNTLLMFDSDNTVDGKNKKKTGKYDPKKDFLKLLVVRDMYPVNYEMLIERISVWKISPPRRGGRNFLVECVTGKFNGEILLSRNFEEVKRTYARGFEELSEKIFGETVDSRDLLERIFTIVEEFTNELIDEEINRIEKLDEGLKQFTTSLRNHGEGILIRLGGYINILYKTVLLQIRRGDRGLYRQLVTALWRRSSYAWEDFPLSLKLTSSNKPLGWCVLKLNSEN